MEITVMLAILAIIALGTYFQTVTGFGLGIIVIGLTVSLNLAPLPVIAAVVSIVTLFNCLVALAGKRLSGELKVMFVLIIGIVPGVIAGVYLLDQLSESATNIIRGLIGLMILAAGVNFIYKPKPKENPSAFAYFVFTGFGSGVASGLIGMPGPPIVYHLYRQPFSLDRVRSTLLMVFACTSASRTTYVYIDGSLESGMVGLAMVAIPLVAGVTLVARRYPPPLSQDQLRKIVFTVLMLIGSYLMVSSLHTFSLGA